jgi:hypothetical protein
LVGRFVLPNPASGFWVQFKLLKEAFHQRSWLGHRESNPSPELDTPDGKGIRNLG